MVARDTNPIVVFTPLAMSSIVMYNVWCYRSPPRHVEKLEEKWLIPREFPSGFTHVYTFLQNSYSSFEVK